MAKEPIDEQVTEQLLLKAKKTFPAVTSFAEITLDMNAYLILSLCDTVQQAFSAYHDPRVHGLVQAVATDPVQNPNQQKLQTATQHIQYVNYQHVKNKVAGVIKIQLNSAENVEMADGVSFFKGNSDPYVLFSVGSYYVRSATAKNKTDPVWNSTQYLVIPKEHVWSEGEEQKLTVSMFDEDWLPSDLESFLKGNESCDRLLASRDLDLEKLTIPGEQKHRLQFQNNNSKGVTHLMFSTEFVEFETAYREVATAYSGDGDGAAVGVLEEKEDWMHQVEDEKMETGLMTNHGWVAALERVPLDPIAFITSARTDTQVWVCANRGVKCLTISFRGTELEWTSSGSELTSHVDLSNAGQNAYGIGILPDLITDLRFTLSGIEVLSESNDVLHPSEELSTEGIRVHNGFLEAYASVRESLMQIAYDITEWKPDWHLCITGHSLGGALAKLCAFEFANRRCSERQTDFTDPIALHCRNSTGTSPLVEMMSFGAPRVGNRHFVDVYDRTVPFSFRCVANQDPVKSLPPTWLDYQHVSNSVVFHDNEVVVEEREEETLPEQDSGNRASLTSTESSRVSASLASFRAEAVSEGSLHSD